MKILYLEDDPIVRITFRDILTQNGHECWAVSSIQEALAQIAAEKPDVLLLDINLGIVQEGLTGGLEVAKAVKDTLPIVFITNHYNDTYFKQAEQYSKYFLSKAVNELPQFLLDAIENAYKDFHTAITEINPAKVAFRSDGKFILLAEDEIYYIEGEGEYSKIFYWDYRENKINHFLFSTNLGRIERQITCFKNLKRVSKSVLVNREKIIAIEGAMLYVKDVARPIVAKADVHKELGTYIQFIMTK